MRYQPNIKYQKIVILQRDIFNNILNWECGPLQSVTLAAYPDRKIAEKMARKWIENHLELHKIPEYKRRTRGYTDIKYVQIPEQEDFGKVKKVNKAISYYQKEKSNRMKIVK